MAIFLTPCTIIKVSKYDLFGAEVKGERKRATCAVVKLLESAARTTVRVDSGATRGGAEERHADAVLLFSPKSYIGMGDIVEMSEGQKLKVIQLHRRYSATGSFDHFEVECKIG